MPNRLNEIYWTKDGEWLVMKLKATNEELIRFRKTDRKFRTSDKELRIVESIAPDLLADYGTIYEWVREGKVEDMMLPHAYDLYSARKLCEWYKHYRKSLGWQRDPRREAIRNACIDSI